jgi:hypothetical protein
VSAELEREIESLRERLAEAEEMRRAIVRAEIDGFVVGEGDDDRYVHLLSGAYVRDVAERQRRHQRFDENTRRFLSLLAIELLHMVKGSRASLEALRRELGAEKSPDALDALDSLERQAATLQRVAEDLRSINPRE